MQDIPWNAPFYQRRGFRIVATEDLSEGLIRLKKAEATAGLPMDRRVIMRREF